MKGNFGFWILDFGLRRWPLVTALLLAIGGTIFAQTNSITPTPVPAATNAVAAAAEDIRDIRGLVPIPSSWRWLWYTLLALALLLAAWWLIRWWKRRRQARLIPKPKLPHELALERLEAARALMNPAQVQAFAFAVSNAVRFYIEDRFQEKAARRTTEEFLHDLLEKSSANLAQHAALLEDFMRHCDLVKFARWTLSVPEMQGMHDSARKFVEETRPQTGSGPGFQVPGHENPRPDGRSQSDNLRT
jgi:hypothetical protein